MTSKILIDSHILIWLIYEPERLGEATKDLLRTTGMVYVSTASLWELALKYHKGKLPYSPLQLKNGAEALGLSILKLDIPHVLRLETIELPHADPFDRMLLAQSEHEGCLFLTRDSVILASRYQVHDSSL